MFTDWVGISPKKFLKYISLEHAKSLLSVSTTLFDAAIQTGLSGTGRLHDLFVTIEQMTPGEYKNHGKNLHITYSFNEGPFGNYLIAATDKGVCNLLFCDKKHIA